MKRLSFIIISIFFCVCNIKGESEPFIVPGYPTIVVWPLETTYAEYPAFWHANYHTSEGDFYNLTYKILGDSTVNDIKYGMMRFYYGTKEDLLTGIGLYAWGQPYGKTEFADTLLYRQDGDKVFCIPKGENEEVLIVDFGLQTGDEFVDGKGERFRVTGTRFLKDKYDNEWTAIGSCYVMCRYFYSEPKVIELVSITTGEQDTWVEGIGSLNWGVLPMYIAEKIKPFNELNKHPLYARVCVASPENMVVMPNINMEDYKATLILDCEPVDNEEPYVNFSFDSDTLCVNGIQNTIAHIKLLYAECLIAGNRVDIKFKQRNAFQDKMVSFNLRIPSFRAGTYQVGMPGQEYVTLECKGNNPTSICSPLKPLQETNAIYDLQGRRLDSQFRKRGIYIQDGKKVIR